MVQADGPQWACLEGKAGQVGQGQRGQREDAQQGCHGQEALPRQLGDLEEPEHEQHACARRRSVMPGALSTSPPTGRRRHPDEYALQTCRQQPGPARLRHALLAELLQPAKAEPVLRVLQPSRGLARQRAACRCLGHPQAGAWARP